MKNFEFPESVQSNLYAMLTEKQRVETSNVFRHLKKPSQVELSFILMDYIEDAVIPEFQPEDLILSAAFVTLTSYGMPDRAPWAITPGQNHAIKQLPASKQPRRLGEILADVFPMFNNKNK